MGSLQPDPSNSDLSALTYLLPSSEIPVGNGDISVLDTTGSLSDVVRFTDAVGALRGFSADRLIVYSTPDGGDLADTDFPINAGSGAGVEITKTGNSFTFGSTNVYTGVSTVVPEPGSAVLIVSTLTGLAMYRGLRKSFSARRI